MIALLIVALAAPPGQARTPEPALLCDHVAQIAARETGVPVSVLQAITRTETGRKKNGRFGPWPWTVNMEGKGVWFDTLDEARSYVFRHFKRGARSFDVGCFQINYKWHHHAFSSIDEMFDPVANAVYAARFLKSLHDELGNWTEAAGAYHSRTPKYANRYKKIFSKHHGKTTTLAASTPSPTPARKPAPPRRVPKPRVNTYPLLQAGEQRSFGSLVPVGVGTAGRTFLDMQQARDTALSGG